MKVLLYLLILISFLNADVFSILDKYRKGKNFEKLADKFLYSNEYIKHLLKNKDVKFGYYDKPKNIIVCFKDKRVLKIYKYQNILNSLDKFTNILTGRNKGDKWIEGDGKTPIGVYNLTKKLNDNQLNDFYGPLAYPTNYPNLYDKYLGKNGHGIWIHGFPKDDPHRDFDTKGCIAIPNNELIKISNKINYKDSILIITRSSDLPTTNKRKIAIILKNIFKWRYAWKYNKLKEYLSFYDTENFKKSNKYDFDQFAQMKKYIFSIQKNKTLKFKNIDITPYPSIEKDIYRISFDEFFKAGYRHFEGKKIVYLKLTGNKIKIFLEN
jgi:murein L,D-transpeptidase YafK